MPRDMTMERPNPRIVAIVLHDNISIRLQQLHVPSLRIAAIHNTTIPGADPFVQHVHIMPVHVHGVRYGGGVFDNQTYRGSVARVVDVPFGIVGVGCVGRVCE